MPGSIHRITKKYLDSPVEVRVESKTTTSPNIRQRYLTVMHSHKLDALTRVLEIEEYDAIIMFVRTKQATEELADKLRARGFTASAINGDVPQQTRQRTVEQLRGGAIDILVATDVAARGLDVERIGLVVNYDIPHDTESYVHRIGRTGRAGRSGEAILFVTPRETHLLRQIEKATRQPVEKLELPTVEQLTNSRIARFAGRITETRTGSDLTDIRPVIEDYIQTHDVTAEEVAAALAVLVLDGESLKARAASRAEGPRREQPERAPWPEGRDAHLPDRRGTQRPRAARRHRRRDRERGRPDLRTDRRDRHPHDRTRWSICRRTCPTARSNRLSRTKIQGRPIDIRPDKGRPGRPYNKRSNDSGGYRGDRDGRRPGRPGGRDVSRADAKKSFRRND